LVICLVLCVALPASAVEFKWKSGTGNWGSASNWTPLFGPPNAGDTAVIASFGGPAYQANLNADVTGIKAPAQLSLGDNGRVDTKGFRMRVDGPVYLFNDGALLDVRPVTVDPTEVGFSADTISISFDANLRMNGGRIQAGLVQLDDGAIILDDNSRIDASTLISIGDGVGATNAALVVFSGATGTLSGPVRFHQDANVNLATQSELRLAGNTTFQGGGNYIGNGLFRLDGATTVVHGNTTINMPSGRVDLDGSEEPLAAGQSLVVNADLTINALLLDAANNTFGAPRLIGKDVIQINNWGKLGINLTNDDTAWTMRGHLDVNAVGGQVIAHSLSGSPMFLTGTAEVSGNSSWSALTEVAGSIQINADSHLRFSGGDLTKPNLMSGGTISGPGTLGSLSNQKLAGHGTLNTRLQFLGNSELWAEGGKLTLGLESELVAVGTIGTEGADAELLVQNAWNTNVAADSLRLKGGKVTGGDLINGGTTQGFGSILTNSFVNHGLLQPVGVTLVIDPATAPDLDGGVLLNKGSVDAMNGNMIVKKALSDSFNSTLTVGQTRWVTFQQGWRLEHSALPLVSTGVLNLHGSHAPLGSAVIAGGPQELAGIVNVDQRGAFHAPTKFDTTVEVNLPGNQDWLELFDSSVVTQGATFQGNGLLRNMEGAVLTLLGNATIGVRFQNDGELRIDDPVLDAGVRRLEATSTAALRLDLWGTDPSMYDALNVQQTALVAGTLVVTTPPDADGYVDPAVRGQSDLFTLVSASSRSGMFQQFVYNDNMLSPFSAVGNEVRYHEQGGLFRTLRYVSDGVHLLNYLAIAGDANGDGSFNSADFIEVFMEGEYEDGVVGNSDWTDGDWDGDGEFSSADFIAAFQSGLYEQASVLPSVRAVPEPSEAALLGIATLGLLGRRRRK
jgi:hypothetical protein